jgi:hypothetical protein
MKNRSVPRALALAAFLAATSSFIPTGQGFQVSRVDAMASRVGPVSGTAHHEGLGSGSIVLPRLAEDGRMLGVLVDDQSGARFHLDALMMGSIPALGDDGYWFGRFFGAISEPGGSLVDLFSRPASYFVEGFWSLDKYGQGELRGVVVRTATGRGTDVVGNLHGRFEVRAVPVTLHGGMRGGSGRLDPESKSLLSTRRPKPGFRGPYADSMNPARGGLRPKPFSDSASIGTPPFDDLASQPPPRLEGQFGLFFKF